MQLSIITYAYHQNGLVTHALGHMTYGYILLAPMKQKRTQRAKQGA